ncbi:MAG: peptide deformylase [Alphaproteobacteria bacterium]|nr:peptide deformylase [Alphaproteobacteria bacterium]
MALRTIIKAPDPRLKLKAAPVGTVTPDIRQLMADMLETMYAAIGIGLAAPQVGVLARVVVADVAKRDAPRQPLVLADPEILWRSVERASHEEGCLSFPEQFAEVERPARVRIGYLDETGSRRELMADGLLATCLQHEIDHLSGVVFVDYVSPLKRNMILRKLRKAKRLEAPADEEERAAL